MVTAESPPRPDLDPDPGEEGVVPVRHPGRWLASVVIVAVAVLGVDVLVRNPRFQWRVVWHYAFSGELLTGLRMTLWLTLLAMGIGVALGIVVAVMRVSRNPIVSWASRLYIWFFRGTPLLVQLIFWYNIAALFPTIRLGLPGLTVANVSANDVVTPFAAAMLGLGLNEAAYMSEIVRAGLLSVDRGQEEAATALALSWGQTMRFVVVPQAMKIIIPPTGNEVISMLKTTSLVAAIPLSIDLYGVSRGISAVTFTPVPLLIVASLWYLLFTSVLMVGQHFIEKRFSRGTGRADSGRRSPTSDTAQAAGPTAAPGAVLPGEPGAPLGNDFGGKG